MKKCPNPICKSRSHAPDAIYCHLCGWKLVEKGKNGKESSHSQNSGYGLREKSDTSTTGTSGYGDTDIDYAKLFKWILGIGAIVVVVALIVNFWEEIIHFIGAVIFIIIVISVIVSSN